MTKLYDCFSYWDEDLLLDLRLNILDEYVDYFVIVEGNKTWQNNPKKLRFDINKFSQIYFSSGPGSFTALRSIKAISQALALSSNAKLLSTSSFSLLLVSTQIREKNVVVCFKSTNNNFFYHFKIR